ncbi:hypothetical protein GE21DRAFT_1344004 [Neurospora crassa]|nr:hypothetical protein GE21DRAFT_1344004 [Neurospora crassa]
MYLSRGLGWIGAASHRLTIEVGWDCRYSCCTLIQGDMAMRCLRQLNADEATKQRELQCGGSPKHPMVAENSGQLWHASTNLR